jgi:hypothetical protein
VEKHYNPLKVKVDTYKALIIVDDDESNYNKQV